MRCLIEYSNNLGKATMRNAFCLGILKSQLEKKPTFYVYEKSIKREWFVTNLHKSLPQGN